jgi:hypothetical protein
MQLPSKLQIGDQVEYSHYYEGPTKWGAIVSVKFTKAKVLYDILDDASGRLSKEIDSVLVKEMLSETPVKETA